MNRLADAPGRVRSRPDSVFPPLRLWDGPETGGKTIRGCFSDLRGFVEKGEGFG